MDHVDVEVLKVGRTPPTLGAIGALHADFRQVSDAQVHDRPHATGWSPA